MAHPTDLLSDVGTMEPLLVDRQLSDVSKMLVLIDPSVANYRELAAGAVETADVIILRDDGDAIAQITEALRQAQSPITSLHLVTHGNPGGLQFSHCEFGLTTLSQYSDAIAQWGRYLSPDASLLLYGCNVSAGEVGLSFLQHLHQLVQRPIAASSQKVGHALLGGSWQLSSVVGRPDCTLPFDAHVLQQVALVLTTVTNISPSANDIDVLADSNIVITFDTNIDAATVNAISIEVRGSLTGEIAGVFSTAGSQVTFNPTDDFKPGELISIVVTDAVQSVTSTPATAYSQEFTAISAVSEAVYTLAVNQPPSDTQDSYDVAFGDLDGDGSLDAFVVNSGSANQVLLNDGSGVLSAPANQPPGAGDLSFGVELGDLDGDGDLDAFVANLVSANQVLLNDGSGQFSVAPVSLPSTSDFSTSVALGDIDGDGDLDAFVANFNSTNQILLNDGTGAFSAAPNQLSEVENTNGASFGDLDGDGDLDLFIANQAVNQVLLNDGTGIFSTPVSHQLSGEENSFSVHLGDLDSDSDLDAFVVNEGSANQVLLNDGSGIFTAAANQPPGVDNSSMAGLGDVDGDGDLDAFVANSSSTQPNQLLLNDGTGTFVEATNQPPSNNEQSRGIGLGDIDGDGDIDAFVVNSGTANQIINNGALAAANAAPSFTGDAVLTTVNEGATNPSGEAISVLFGTLFQDADDGSSLGGVVVNGNTASAASEGVWQYSVGGASWSNISTTVSDAAALALAESTLIRFLPNIGYNGNPPSLSVRALDNTYSDGFSTVAADEIVDVSVNGGSTAISASTHAISTTIASIANVIFVNKNATGTNDGGSWANAYTDLQSALAIASDGDEIWLAQGTYTPGATREATFSLTDELAIYGGFVGTESSISDRDVGTNETILSGEIGVAGNSDNSYHVVTSNSTAGAIIDGVIIQDGNTQGAATDNDDDGGGVYNQAKLTLENVVVRNNVADDDGGGIRNDGELTIINSTVADNTALSSSSSTSGGGGLLNTVSASATVINTTFSGNQAKAGGGIRNDAQLTLINTTVSGNLASESGGGLINTTTDPFNPAAPAGNLVLINSTITNNEDQNSSGNNFNGAGIANFASLTATNSIIAGNNNNDDIRNHFTGTSTSQGNNFIGNGSNASGFTNGSNNDQVGSDTTPLDPLLGSLQNNGGFTQTHAPDSNSLVIDGGNNSNIGIDSVDLDGDADTTETVPFGQRGSGFDRVVNGTVDIGAVESTTGPNTAPSLTGDGVLLAVDEDSTAPLGDTVANLLNAQFSDPDVGAALSGVAVVGNASGVEGTWQYSTDGTTWLDVSTVADDATALALSAATRVRFVPAADYNGDAPVLMVRALDDTYSGSFTSGATRQSVDTTNNGGRSAIAQSTNNITTSITAVNDAPILSVSGLQLSAVDEDPAAPVGAVGTVVSDLIDSASTAGGLDNVVDIDAGALVGIAVTTTDTANGAWFYSLNNGVNWLSLGAVSASNARLLASNSRVYFQPNADFNGSIANAIRFQAWDQSAGANGDLVDVSVNGGVAAFSTAVESASITVNPVNDAPTVALQNVLTSLNEDASTTARTKVADIVVSDIDAGVNTLSLSGTEASLFEIDGTELFLKAGVTLDFETLSQLSVSVEVDDSSVGTAPDDAATLLLPIVDVNEAPSAITLQSPVTTLAEDTDTSTPRKLADIVVTDDALGTNSFSVVGTDAASFEVVGTELFLKAGISLDFEGQQQYNITVQVDDAGVGAAPDATVDFSLDITDVNEAPTSLTLLNTTTTLDENIDTTARVKVADINVVDDALGTSALSVTGDDAADLEIVGSELFLRAGTALDFETKSQYDISVQVDDVSVGGTPDALASFSLSVEDVNEAPSAIALNNTTPSLNENIDTASALKVADIAISDDADVANSILSLVGTDAADFEIVGTELRLKAGTSLDFETKSQYDVTVQVDDATVGGSPDATQAFTLMVTDVNEAPTALSLQNEQFSLAENVDTTARVKVADIVIADDALGSNSLSVTGTDAAAFEVIGTELFIKAGTNLDLETQAQYDVTVQVDDTTVGASPDATVDFSLSVTDVNEAPTAVTLQNVVTALAENTDTTGRIKLADISITDDAIGTNSLTLSGADAASFEIEGAELFLRAGTTLDTEGQSQYDIVVQVDDASVGTLPDATTSFSLSVTDVNEAPTAITLTNAITTIDENVDTTSRIKVADVVVDDDAIGVNVVSVTGDDASSFEVVGSELFLRAGTALDFEAKDQYDIVVQVGDASLGATPDAQTAFSLAITDVNEAPTAVALLNPLTALDENTDTTLRVKVADIAITDDALGTNTLSVASGDAAAFEIDGSELFLKAGTVLDFESQDQYDIVVQVDDADAGVAPDATTSFSLSVNDVNEAPSAISLTNTTPSLAEDADTSVAIKVADINVSDDANGTNTLALSGSDAAAFSIVGTELFLNAGTVLDFETKAQYDVRIEVDDASVGSSPDATVDFTLALTDVNEAPTAVTLENVVTSLTEDRDTTTRIKLADIAIADDALGTNVLTLAGTDAADFEIDGTELFLKAGVTLDLESQAQYDVTVQVDDAAVDASPDATVDFSLAVTDVNEAPTAVTLQNVVAALAENANTTDRVKLADIVVTDDAIGSNALSITGADAALFEIVGSELFLQAGTTLDSESQAQYDVTVQVDDAGVGATPDASAAFSLAVTDVNEAPTAVTFSNAINAIDENTDTTSRLKVADINVVDDSIGVNTLSLAGVDASAFEIVGTQLFLAAGKTLDFEAQSQYDIVVQVDDASVGAEPDALANFGLAVTDINEAPNTLSLQNPVVSLAETADTTSRIKLADIAFLDDALGSNALSVAGSDAALFEIDGNELFLSAGATLDFESQSQYDVTVSVDDAAVGSTPDEIVAYSLSLTDVNEAPSAVSLNIVVSELGEDADTSSRIKVADIAIADDALGTNDLSLAGTDASSFEIEGAELFLKAGATLNFEAQAQLDVSVVVDDVSVGAAVDASSSLPINITDANEAPSLVSLQNVTNTLDENSSTDTRVKVSDIVVADDALGTNALSLSGDDASDFEIVGSELFLKAGTVLDFEAKAGFDVSILVDDVSVGNSPDAGVDFRLDVTDLNEAPSAVTLQNAVTIIAENVDTAGGVKLADIAIIDDALGNNELTLVGTDAGNFEIVDGALFLKAGTSLNRLTQSQYDVTVQVDDGSVGSSPDATAALSLEIAENNDAPTAIEIQNAVATLAEDTNTTTRTALGDLVITDDPVGSNNLAVTGADAEFFEIDAGQLYLKAGVTLDFEAQSTYDITIAVDDPTVGESPDAVTSFSLAISDVNEAPSAIAFMNALTSLAENADTTAQLKVADIVVTDDALGTNVLSLSGADAGDFVLVGSELFLRSGTALDFETKTQYDVSVVVDDAAVGAGIDATADFSLSITDINEAPVSVTLDNVTTTLAENISTGSRTKVADIVVSDDGLGDNTLLVTGSDADSFEIVGTELFLKAGVSLDHESQAQYDIAVAVDDATVGESPDATVDYSLAVADVNEAPSAVTLQTVTVSLAENLNLVAPVKVADISVTDDALGSQNLTLGGADAGEFSIVGSELFLNAGTTLNFEETARYDVSVQVDDPAVGGDIDASADFSLVVEDVNEAPTVLRLPTATAVIAENIDITNHVKLTDILITDDAIGMNDLTVVGADASIFEIVGNELFVRAGTTLDKATQDQYSVTVQVNDASFGVGPNATATFDLSIAETNDAPTAVALQNALSSIAENIDTQSPVKVADIVVTDDPVGINDLTVVGADADLFEIVGTELFLKASVSIDFESQAQYDVTIQVDDVSIGNSPDAAVDFSLAVTDVNEAPTLLTNTLTIVQGDTVVLSRENLAASDVDNSADQIIYTVSALSGGQFEQVIDSSVVTSFNQTQIDGGEIQFVHDNSDNAPSYAVSVSDGELSTAAQSVTIGRFIRPGDGPLNVVPTAQDTNENEALVFSSAGGNQLAVENLGSANDLAVTLSVDRGVLTLGDLDELSFVVGDGREDRTLEFVGVIADVNAALNGLILTPDRGYTGNINLQIVSEDQGLGEAFADSDTVTIEVTPGETPNVLNAEDNNLVSVAGGSGGSQLSLSLQNVDSNQVNEVIVAETDEQGRIDGFAPGDAGYLEALIAQSQVVLSTLASGFDGLDIERTLDVIGNVSLQFAVIQGGSLDEVRRGAVHNIRLATPVPNDSTFNPSGSILQAQQLSDHSLQLGFEIEGGTGFDDIILLAVLEDVIAPTGSNLQGDTESELIDLRSIVGPVTATFEVYREAEFDNVVGFFTVENSAGQVLDAQGNLLNVGDAGYVEAAIARRVAVDLTTENGQVSTYRAEVAGGQLLASFIISDGSVESLLDSDAGNDPSVFFTHIGANSDRSDHIRLLGDNTFGFEDMAGGGDQDFDDIVVKATFS